MIISEYVPICKQVPADFKCLHINDIAFLMKKLNCTKFLSGKLHQLIFNPQTACFMQPDINILVFVFVPDPSIRLLSIQAVVKLYNS